MINFPKYEPKNLKDFCLMYFRAGRNPSKIFGSFLEN
jgi:hypothetical protein